MKEPSLLVCATEISGDVRGARLAREMLRVAPGLHIYGLGGGRMRGAGVDVRIDITDRGTVGWFDHWLDLPCYLAALRFWRREIRQHPPAAAMVIDAPGISFPFARVARAAGLPVIYFVTPQTWLWNPARALERLRACADIVVPTLQAEAALYDRAGLQVVYEGHPALDDLVDTYGAGVRAGDELGGAQPPPQPFGPGPSSRSFGAPGPPPPYRIAVVPGSRRHAIRRLLPVMLDAIDMADRTLRIGDVVVGVAARALRPEVDACLRGRTRTVRIIEEDLNSALQSSDVAIASTGGNLLEAAFAGVPAIACYRVDPLTYLGARHLLRLHRRITAYALPNLIAEERVVPELIQQDVTPRRVAQALVRLLSDEGARDAIRRGYGKVRAGLGKPGVNVRVADRIIRLADLRCPGLQALGLVASPRGPEPKA